jgi:hypothetical protein
VIQVGPEPVDTKGMHTHDGAMGGMRALLACGVLVGLLAGACTTANARAKTASGSGSVTSLSLATVAATVEPSSTTSTVEPSAGTSTTGRVAASVTTAPPVTGPRRWVTVAVFAGSGEKEGQTFTITGAPARVSYKASGLFSLNIDTGDPADDTVIGSCPIAGCTQQGAVHVVPGGWYLHVTNTPPATTYSITLEEYR